MENDADILSDAGSNYNDSQLITGLIQTEVVIHNHTGLDKSITIYSKGPQANP